MSISTDNKVSWGQMAQNIDTTINLKAQIASITTQLSSPSASSADIQNLVSQLQGIPSDPTYSNLFGTNSDASDDWTTISNAITETLNTPFTASITLVDGAHTMNFTNSAGQPITFANFDPSEQVSATVNNTSHSFSGQIGTSPFLSNQDLYNIQLMTNTEFSDWNYTTANGIAVTKTSSDPDDHTVTFSGPASAFGLGIASALEPLQAALNSTGL